MPDLVKLLAEKVNCGSDTAGQFLREFAVVVGQGLVADSSVRIAGLGTFKVSNDVNGKRTVEFAPEQSLAATVNEPFEIFDTVEVADSVTDEDLAGPAPARVSVPAAPATEPVVSAEPVNVASPTTPPEIPATEEPKVELEPAPAAEPQAEPAPVAEPEPQVVPPPIPERFKEVKSEQPAAEPEPEMPEPEVAETEPEQPAVEEPAEPEATEPEVSEPIIPSTEQSYPHPTPTASPMAPAARDYDAPVSVVLEPESRVTIRRLGHTSLTLIVTAIAACLLGFVIGYVVYRYTSFGFSGITNTGEVAVADSIAAGDAAPQVLTPDEAEAARLDSIARAARQDSIAKAADAARQAEQQVVTDTVRAGNFLTRMARRHYGDSRFWVYIYLENKSKIKDPDNLEAGTVLVIPPAEKYGIDATNRESLKKADQEAYKALNE
jgi:nucleoid DNA-binding protein